MHHPRQAGAQRFRIMDHQGHTAALGSAALGQDLQLRVGRVNRNWGLSHAIQQRGKRGVARWHFPYRHAGPGRRQLTVSTSAPTRGQPFYRARPALLLDDWHQFSAIVPG